MVAMTGLDDTMAAAREANGDAAQRFIEFSDQPAWSIVDLVEESEGLDPEAAQAIFDRSSTRADSRQRGVRPCDISPH